MKKIFPYIVLAESLFMAFVSGYILLHLIWGVQVAINTIVYEVFLIIILIASVLKLFIKIKNIDGISGTRSSSQKIETKGKIKI